jgi:hypothetical protein
MRHSLLEWHEITDIKLENPLHSPMSLLVHQCVPEKGIYTKRDITSIVTGRGVQIAFADECLELCCV